MWDPPSTQLFFLHLFRFCHLQFYFFFVTSTMEHPIIAFPHVIASRRVIANYFLTSITLPFVLYHLISPFCSLVSLKVTWKDLIWAAAKVSAIVPPQFAYDLAAAAIGNEVASWVFCFNWFSVSLPHTWLRAEFHFLRLCGATMHSRRNNSPLRVIYCSITLSSLIRLAPHNEDISRRALHKLTPPLLELKRRTFVTNAETNRHRRHDLITDHLRSECSKIQFLFRIFTLIQGFSFLIEFMIDNPSETGFFNINFISIDCSSGKKTVYAGKLVL